MRAIVSIHIALHAAVLTLVACNEPSPLYPAGSPPEIVQACSLTELKCTACHDRERYQVARHSPERWEKIVHKMRLFPGSAITPADADVILRCLNYRSSATSLDMHPRRHEMDARAAMYVMPRSEVQALHFDLHNVLHVTPNTSSSSMRNPLE
jgi:hypothetical protein